MPLRNARALTFRPASVTDAVDGTNAAPGSLAQAADLIPSMHTKGVWVPRPAAIPFYNFASFAGPVRGEDLLVVGTRIYGMVASNRFPGQSEPFIYDTLTQQSIAIAGVTAGNTPKSAPATGDWTPPTSVPIGAWVLFTHPGFVLPNAFGWLDMTGFSDTATGTTGYISFPGVWGTMSWGAGIWGGINAFGGIVISNLSKDTLLAGWRPGMLITDSAGQIPAGTRIAAISTDGLSIMLTQAATGAVVNDALTVVGGTPSAPLWAAGNTTGLPLPGVPVAVSQFNGRAWWALKSATPFSESLDPLQRVTQANGGDPALTFDNGLDVTAFGTIPFSTQLGGVVQVLLAFQGDGAIQQITGDPVTNNLSKDLFSEIGTLAPNAIVSTPIGILFIAPDGLRIISQDGTVGQPIGAEGDGVSLPFINAIYPSRMCAAYNEDVYRVSATYNATVGGSAVSQVVSGEFWYHLKLGAWSGPHSFPAALVAPLDTAPFLHGHVMFALDQAVAPGLWFSNTRPMLDSTYTENGKALTWVYQTTRFPDTKEMFVNGMNETAVMLALPAGAAAVVSFVDVNGTLLDAVQLLGTAPPAGAWGRMIWDEARWGGAPTAPGVWDTMVWGASVWGSGVGGATLVKRLVPWDREVVFSQGHIIVSGPSSPQAAIGNIFMRYQRTGYTTLETGQFAAISMQ